MGGTGPGAGPSVPPPNGTRILIGRSMPSANTAATPGSSDTTWRDWPSSRFIAAPTRSRSSAAGSRCITLSAVFLTTSLTSFEGICSAITSPSP